MLVDGDQHSRVLAWYPEGHALFDGVERLEHGPAVKLDRTSERWECSAASARGWAAADGGLRPQRRKLLSASERSSFEYP